MKQDMKKNDRNPKIVFLLTNLAFQALIGQFGVYSIVKSPMAELFNYDQSFLGIIQALQIFGELCGSVFIIFISVNSVKGYLIAAVFNLLLSLLLILPRYLSNIAVRDFTIIFCYFWQCFFTASLAYTQVIFSNYFDENAKKCQHSVWYSLTFVGDLFSLLFTQILVYNLGFNWQYAKVLWSAYVLIVALLMSGYLGHQDKQEQAEIDQILSQQSEIQEERIEDGNNQKQQQQLENKVNKKDKNLCCSLFKKAINLLKQSNILLVVISFALIESVYGNLLFWLPYFYISVGSSEFSMLSLLTCCGSITIGGLIIEVILFESCNLEKHSHKLCYLFLTISCAAYTMIWFERSSQPQLHILLLAISNFFMSSPYSRISSSEPIEESDNNPHKIKLVFLLAHLFRNITIATCVLIIGFVMKINPTYFWHVVFANVVLAFIVESWRKLCMGRKNGENQLKNDTD